MANKTYIVMKDGEVIRETRSLVTARKLADKENAEVMSEGVCVYAPDPEIALDEGHSVETPDVENEESVDNGTASAGESSESIKGAAVLADVATDSEHAGADTPDQYRLKHPMNVRTAPSLDAGKLEPLPAGTIVSVLCIKDDWMNLVDGTFILYGGGIWAEKA